MLVKKMPILQGFSDFETVKFLSKMQLKFSEFRPIFYDIETTGLAQSSSFLYLIGAVVFEETHWQLYQWFAESQEEEPVLLKAFSDFLKPCTCTVQYNGNRFDQPYLEKKYALHHQKPPFQELPALDLYQSLRPCQPFLKLARMKQPDLETFLGLSERRYCDGEECIRIYRKYVKTGEPALAETVLGHNREDLLGLGKIFSMLSYLCLYQGEYALMRAETQGEQLLLALSLPVSLPVPVSNGNTHFYIRAREKEARLLLPLKEGRLRHYYPDYKAYDYLPGEDTAVPKALSAYIDKSLRIPARPETCYTWIPCNEAFLQDPQKQLQYLRHTLPCLLNILSVFQSRS